MFVPIHDLDNPVKAIPWPYVTHAIIALNLAMYLFFSAAGERESVGTLVLLAFRHGAVEISSGLPYADIVLPGPLTALTSAFIHVDFWHLAGNMLFLWVFGDNVEDALGHARFALFYAVSAIAAAYAQALFTDPGYILYGASGAVSAVIAAFLMLHPRVRVWVLVLMKFPLRITAFWVIGAWIAFQLYNVAVEDTDAGVGWWAHIGGLVAGAALLPLMKRRGVPLFDKGPKAPA